jgi:DNA gyrase subunit A
MAVDSLRVMGRATQGVRLIKVREDDSIAAVAKVMREDDPELDESLQVADSQNTPVDVSAAEATAEQTSTEEE